jgi:hypothetical protein
MLGVTIARLLESAINSVDCRAVVGDGDRACAVVLANVRDRLTTAAVGPIKLVSKIDQVISQLRRRCQWHPRRKMMPCVWN